ncbi:Os06g0279800 [Oryza sativa Japonica Group]|uniref:Uncharacterized protein n=2 Tax=Oryza sativa subsp. japonica TaxID=39947 RepID=A3BAN8_ORYSJ|nr:hypothetical protein OsJ_20971 [Oryza sativa Japonica Group]BAD69172.1 hypothetical protein [Oryza sativa Japonica Group]BAS97242.1 Os06g0279800 [Oryza sativa Japonica Group]
MGGVHGFSLDWPQWTTGGKDRKGKEYRGDSQPPPSSSPAAVPTPVCQEEAVVELSTANTLSLCFSGVHAVMQQHDQLVVMAASPAAPEAERLTAAGVAKEELVAAVRIQAAEVMRAAAPQRGEGQHVLLGTAGETRAAPQGLADAVDVDGLKRADDERPPAGSMTTPPRRPRPVGANTVLQRLQLPPPMATTRRRADDAAAVDLEWTRMV